MTLGDFVLLMLPYTIVSLILISLFIILGKRLPVTTTKEKEKRFSKKYKIYAVIYALIFVSGILTVCKLIPWFVFLAVSIIAAFIMNKSSFKTVDYSLLLTFICFFIFIGNISSLSSVRQFLTDTVNGRETLISIAASQLISNVPAALMLSGFTKRYSDLIVGVDLGGLGTLIASMASLISYKAVAAAYPEKRKKYILIFTAVNIAFLVILYSIYLLL